MDDTGNINARRTRRRNSTIENENKISQQGDDINQRESERSNTFSDTMSKVVPHTTLNTEDDNESRNVTDNITDGKDTSENSNSMEINNSENGNLQQIIPENTTNMENTETKKEEEFIEENKTPNQQAGDNTLSLKDLSPELVKNLQKNCELYKDIIEALQQGLSSKEYIMIGGLLHYIDPGTKRNDPIVRTCIPKALTGFLP